VYEVLAGYVWHKDGSSTYSCEDSWSKLFPYCVSYYNMLKSNQLEGFLAPRIAAMNSALDKLASEWSQKSTRNHYISLPHVHDDPYEKNYFAVDCFHMSELGQQTLAHKIMSEMGKSAF